MARSALPRADLDGDGSPCGGFEVPTIDGGKTKVKVPRARIRPAVPPRRQGMPVLRSREAGDMYVQVLSRRRRSTKRQKELLANSTSSPRPKRNPRRRFLHKVKDFLDGWAAAGPADRAGHARLDPVGTAATPLLQSA